METPRSADSPFDPASHTPDVILRSSDNVDFYVMKSFLAFSSPDFFAAMFSLPQTQHDIPSPSGLHIVPVAEDSKALRILLLQCYPLDLQDEENDVIDIARAIVAARKYVMDIAEKRIEKILFSKALFLLERHPLHIYMPWLVIPSSHLSPSPELNHITGMDMYQLNECRHRCVKAIWDWYFKNKHGFEEQGPWGELVEEPYVWFDERSHKDRTSGQLCTFECTQVLRQDDWNLHPPDEEVIYNIYATPWWTAYFVGLMKAIELCPSKQTVLKFSEAYYDALRDSSSCTFCRLDGARHLDYFKGGFGWNVEAIVKKEISELEFQTSN
ncbi:hypothetical protein M413DRAFT_24954 [Hebeloma cylindrosporum]|uniref:BTB domain-containing protein n=1 Tax=Hebeloma cylindrosporum TaxID=76867 RepID=A0A0C3CK20_HEBCY|nr:hypothetical protein M413DRAFT_24954 [Hebeloma cylindrosporum h7]